MGCKLFVSKELKRISLLMKNKTHNTDLGRARSWLSSRQRRRNTRGWQSMCFGNEYKKFALLLSTVRIARRFSTEHSWFRGYFVHTKKDMGNVNQKWEIIVLKADECSLKCYKCMSPAPIANNLKRLSHWTTYWWIHNWMNNWAIFLEFLWNISHPPAHYWWRIRRNQSM